MVQRKINPKTGKPYFLSEPSGPGSDYTGKISSQVDPIYDNVDIFEGGPAGQVLVDIDPFYGGIQLQEDEKPGDQAMRDLARFTKGVTEFLAPSDETIAAQEETRATNQQILDFIINATGLEPNSFEANQLINRLKREDRDFLEKLGYDYGGLLTGGGTTDRPTYGLFDFGNFFFGDARRGLTTMVDEGTPFKELPFEQKLGIAILPIDVIDVGGLAFLLKTPLGALMRAGQQTFGKGSKLTVKELTNNKEFMQNYLKENPEAAEALEEYGIDIRDMTVDQQSQLGVGADINPKILKQGPVQPEIKQKPVKPKTKKEIEAEEIKKTAEGLESTFEGRQAQDPKPTKTAPAAEVRRLLQNDPDLANEETIESFARFYEAQYAQPRTGQDKYMIGIVGEDNFNSLKKLAADKGLIKIRNMPPMGGTKLTPAGFKFLKDNYKKLTNEELLEKLNEGADLYYYTDRAGNPIGFKSLATFQGYKTDQGFKGGPKRKRTEKLDQRPDVARRLKAVKLFEDKIKEIQKIGKTEITSELLNKEFEFAVRRAQGLGNKELKSAEAKRFTQLLNEQRRTYNASDDSLFKVPSQMDIQREKGGGPGKTKYSQEFSKQLTLEPAFNEAVKFLGDGNAGTLRRYLDFIRSSTPGVKDDLRMFPKFFEDLNPRLKELQDKDSIFRKNYEYFKVVDKARIKMGELSKPFLDKLFKTPAYAMIDGEKIVFDQVLFDPKTKSRRSLQIAHRYEGDQIGKTLPKDLSGASELPQSYTVDVSFINQGVQPKLEAKARIAVRDGDEKAMRKIHLDAERFGTAFEVDGIQFGTQKGIADKLEQYLQYVVRRPDLQEKFGITKQEMLNMRKAIDQARALNKEGYNFSEGGLVKDVEDIFEEEDQIMGGQIMPRISVEFGDAAKGTARRFGEEKPEDMVPLPLSEIQLGDSEPVQRTSAEPQEKMFDVQPTENIFTGEMEQANLKFPFWKMFTQPPKNETAPIPTPKESLDNPTKKQKESLELEKEKTKDQPPLDPTPEDDVPLTDDVMGMDIAVTPKSKTPITGVFYSDIERVLSRPDTPEIFPNKKALLDFLKKNRIRDSEFRDYQIDSLLRVFDENTPIPKAQVIEHLRQAPIRGMHVHATGQFSEVINPNGAVDTRYEGYAAEGFIPGSQRERVLYIPTDKFPGDSGTYPSPIFKGEKIENHKWGMPNQDNAYVIGWTRLTDRMAILPTKLEAPKLASKVPGLTRERERLQRQVAGLYAEAVNKLNREGVRRGLNQSDLELINNIPLEEVLTTYGDTLNQISPGLVDQIDELIVKVRDIDADINKASTPDTSGIVKVTFADEIQSDIMQAAAGRKQKLLATLRKIADEGRESTTLPELDRIGNDALAFFEENKSVFRPLRKSQTEVDVIGERLAKLDAEVDDIINRYIETRELDPSSVKRLKEALNENIDNMINELMQIDTKTYDGLFPDLPFKKREEWADALIKKDLFELAYRKFILKDPNVPDYYAVSPQELVINRYSFKGDSSTPLDVRAADKKRQIDYFMARGEFTDSEYKGIGMSEFYGGPKAEDPDGKHYTSTIEKILKTQAKQNNSEFVVLNVQTKTGARGVYKVFDQRDNLVATLTSPTQADRLVEANPLYRIERTDVPDLKSTTPSFAIKITEEMLEPYKTHKAKGGLVSMIDIFEVA